MNLRIIALLAATLPFFAVHLTWLVAASYGLVEWCNPYIDSCTSISATGRHAPASYVFRATMLPAAVVLALGILTVVLQAWGSVLYDAVEDAFEWVLSLLLQANFLLGYLVWRRAGWQLQFVQAHQPAPSAPVKQEH